MILFSFVATRSRVQASVEMASKLLIKRSMIFVAMCDDLSLLKIYIIVFIHAQL